MDDLGKTHTFPHVCFGERETQTAEKKIRGRDRLTPVANELTGKISDTK